MRFFLAFACALAAMLVLTPRLRDLACRLDYTEKPKADSRKTHTQPKPYLAGLGMFVVAWAVYFLFRRDFSMKSIALLCSSFLIFAVGFVDDTCKIRGRDLAALPKMLGQLVPCALVFFAGVRFTGFSNPLDGGYVLLPLWLQFFLTVTWLFGVTTVINFTDGMDGLAGGVSCIASCTLFLVALSKGDESSALMGVVLVGVCLGYLRYNRYPSQILMGDAGATFLGFMLGIVSLDGAFKQATVLSILVPILALGLPIFDNLYVMFKRLREGRPVYIGDTSQAHFRLLSKGFTCKQVVRVLYLVCLCFNLGAIILMLLDR